MKDKITKQILQDVEEVLSDINIDRQIDAWTNEKRVKELVEREIKNIIIEKISNELMFKITKAVKIKLMRSDPMIERRVLELLVEEFNL